nr:hypothetical protein [Tanacetum cinerariifolium]GEY55347.1 hypothetical protein [Tanacetum cinerariifolium]
MSNPYKNWLVQKQTALGKDKSNPLMADNLPKIVWYSTHHITLMKSWLVQKQTALGKYKSNSLMADNLPKIICYIKYALTINPHIYMSYIKQLWNNVVVKQSNDVTRLQALVDKKKVVITEATIKDALRLDDAEGVDCLPNEEIFAELARMGYEKPSTKLTRLSSQATGNSSSKFYMYPRFIQLIIKNQLGDLSTHTTKYTSPDLTHKVFANMRRVGKGFSGAETPLFEGMLVGVFEEEGDVDGQVQDDVEDAAAQEADAAAQGADTVVQGDDKALDSCVALIRRVEHLKYDKVAQALEITKLKRRVKKLKKENRVKVLKLRRMQKVGTSQRIDTSKDTMMEDASNQGRMIDDLDKDDTVDLMDDKGEENTEEKVKNDQVKGRQAEIYQIDMDHASKVLNIQEDEPAEVQEVVDVVTTAKLITEVVTAAGESVTTASTTISAAEPQVPAATITTAPVRVAAASTRRRKGVVIRDLEGESTTIIPADTKSKDKGKGIMIEKPKPLKKKQQVEMDEEYQFIKKMPQTEAQAQKNMIMYLKNVLEEEENIAIESINETPAQKAAKRKKLNMKVKDLKRHLEIVPDKDDDVYTKATPLARKVLVVDYKIIHLNNKPHYKIIRADGTHQLRYPLSRFTLDKMLNAVRLRVEEQSEMSLELLSFGVDVTMDLEKKLSV